NSRTVFIADISSWRASQGPPYTGGPDKVRPTFLFAREQQSHPGGGAERQQPNQCEQRQRARCVRQLRLRDLLRLLLLTGRRNRRGCRRLGLRGFRRGRRFRGGGGRGRGRFLLRLGRGRWSRRGGRSRRGRGRRGVLRERRVHVVEVLGIDFEQREVMTERIESARRPVDARRADLADLRRVLHAREDDAMADVLSDFLLLRTLQLVGVGKR